MIHVRAWRNFKRMQATACAFAILVYLGAVLHAWRVLPGPANLKLLVTLAFPVLYFLGALVAPLVVPPLRRMLKRYVWLSFAAGFGQSVGSVLTGLGVLAFAAIFIHWQIAGAADGAGRYPAGVFSAFGAGIGILVAQAVLVRVLEREPKVREIIEA